MRDDLHHVGDSCKGGHFDDPHEASRLNDEIVEESEHVEDLQVLVEADGFGALSDRQAALFAAAHVSSRRGESAEEHLERVVDAADVFLDWLEEVDHEEAADV